MNKLFSLFVTLLTIFAPSNKVWAETNIPGLTYNEEGQYYEIPDAAALNTLSAFVNNGNTCEGLTFKQTNAITLTENFVPIGEHKSPSFCMFSGTYDGNNQTISGLSVNGDYPAAGLFGYLFKATVKNVRLISPVIASTNNSGDLFAGALVGRTHSTKEASEYCTITNCIVISPTVGFKNEGGTQYVGAIVGDIRGSFDQVTYCYFYDTQHNYTAIGDPSTMSYMPVTVAQAHHITFDTHVIIPNPSAISLTGHPERGFIYNDTPYYRDGFEITLSSTGIVAETQNGYRVGFSADGGQTWLDGNILTVGTDCHDAAITAGNTAPLDWTTVTAGTADAPYQIKNTAQMELLAQRVNNGRSDYQNKFFELFSNLLYDSEVDNNHTAIGTADHPFRGNFNGAGRVVAFVNINKNADYQGLFGYTDGATISNIQFTDSEVTGNAHVGGIVGYANNGSIQNCLLFRDVVTGSSAGGLIIGDYDGTTLTANFHNGSTYNSSKSGVSTNKGDVEGAYGARKIVLADGIAVDKDVSNPANGFPYGSQRYFRDGLELTVSYTAPLGPNYSVSFVLNDTPIENGVLTITPDCNGKTISPVYTVIKVPQTITYMKSDGTTAEHEALPLDGSETSLKAGEWYYVGEDISYNHTLNLQDGDITLILCDGKSMTFGDSNLTMNAKSINGSNSNLFIYGQSLDAATAGTLSIYTGGVISNDGIDTKTYTQYSGNVTISAGIQYPISVIDFLLAGGSLKIHTTSSAAIYTNNDLIVSGGILDASTMSNNAVLQSSGDIVLGWTRSSDRIHATSYDATGKVRIADGMALKDANASDFFIGVIDDPTDIATKTLVPAACVTFVCTPSETTIDPVVVTPGQNVSRPDDPMLDGHDFLGWYTLDNIGSDDGTPYDFNTAVNGNLTLYGKWSGLEWNFSISYDLNEGEMPEGQLNPTSYNYKSANITLVNPVRTGYTFVGWTGTGLNEPVEPVTIATGSTGNRTYTATWAPIVYPIHYVLNDGEVDEDTPNPTSYTIESSDIKLSNPTRAGYFFLGWTGTGLDEPSEYVYISTGSYGERTYTANWRKGKDFTTCTAVVGNPTYNNGYSVSPFYYSSNIKVYDSEGNLLNDDEFRFEKLESLDYPEYDQNPCTRVGEHCRVTLEGMGDWIGQLTVDVIIISSGIATGISEYSDASEYSDTWYDLNGRKLSSKPMKKGVYIHNGKTIVTK